MRTQPAGPKLNWTVVGHDAVAAVALPPPPVDRTAPSKNGRPRSYEHLRGRAAATLGGNPAAAVRFETSKNTLTSHELVVALTELDVKPLARAGVPPVAVFDFDNTLMRGDVLETFLRLLVHEGAILPIARRAIERELLSGSPLQKKELAQHDALGLARLTLDLFEKGQLRSRTLFMVACAALTGMPAATASALSRQLYEQGFGAEPPYKTRLLAPNGGHDGSAAHVVQQLETAGVQPWIVTAGLSSLAQLGAAYVGIPAARVIGAEMRIDLTGRLTGRAPDVLAVGKDNMVRKKVRVPPLFVFGDSAHSDGPMMRLALARGFMVNATAEFLELARAGGHRWVDLRY